ncbi:hypothetical protein C7C46_18875 [Streptomyces tateyamensis]|uniref:Uncharacterized protein n=1 Tax=Streptomyces tateyamensis TaxID=565073 RepID=A0A2V4N7F7_9ACTN|nr:hypothetical protein C7C46_18875 [Streptomyces tateyamensis]
MPAPDGTCLDHERVRRLQAEWHALQAGFVDDPHQALEQADALVAKSVRLIDEAVTARRTELRGSDVESAPVIADTEQARLALREYRALLERLLTL